jgi:hypothetical protein
MGVSEYPLKRILNFKGLSVRPSIRYPLKRCFFLQKLHQGRLHPRNMYSDPDHIQYLMNFQTWLDENCLEQALMNGDPLDVCFGDGAPLCYWRSGVDLWNGCCNDTLVIDADFLLADNVWAEDLFTAIRNMVRHCPMLNHIWIGGSDDAMSRAFKIVSGSGRRKADMATYIAGINVLKGHHAPPLVVTTMTSFGRGPNARTVRYQYV